MFYMNFRKTDQITIFFQYRFANYPNGGKGLLKRLVSHNKRLQWYLKCSMHLHSKQIMFFCILLVIFGLVIFNIRLKFIVTGLFKIKKKAMIYLFDILQTHITTLKVLLFSRMKIPHRKIYIIQQKATTW